MSFTWEKINYINTHIYLRQLIYTYFTNQGYFNNQTQTISSVMEKATFRQLTENYIHEYWVDTFSRAHKHRVLACFVC